VKYKLKIEQGRLKRIKNTKKGGILGGSKYIKVSKKIIMDSRNKIFTKTPFLKRPTPYQNTIGKKK